MDSVLPESSTDTTRTYLVEGSGFKTPDGKNLKLWMGTAAAGSIEVLSDSLLRFTAESNVASRAERLVIRYKDDPKTDPVVFVLPKQPPPLPSLVIPDQDPGWVGSVVVSGENLDLVKEVAYGDKRLPLYLKDGKWWLYIIGEATAKADSTARLLVSTDTAKIEVAFKVKPAKA